MIKLQENNSVDVLILGAGMAGLTAAYTLKKISPKTTYAVLEARDRVGGRVFTANLGGGQTAEYGGEWIGATHKRMLELCREFKLPLELHRYEQTAYMKHGTNIPLTSFDELFERSEKLLQKLGRSTKKQLRMLDRKNFRHLLREHFSVEEVRLLNDVYSVDFGQDARHVSSVRPIIEHMLGGQHDHMDYHIKGGNSRLPQALHQAIGAENVFLKHPIKKVTQTKQGVTVLCVNGSAWKAKKIISTLPLPALSKVEFSPTFSVRMHKTIKNLRSGNIVKVILQFPKRFWRQENFSVFSDGPGQLIFHTTAGQKGKSGALCIYAVGKKAEKISHMNIDSVWKDLQMVLPERIKENAIAPTSMTRHVWAKDPHAMGAYAVFQPGEEQHVFAAFSKPFHHTYFAGEHLAKFRGFMEGAAETGSKAAYDVRAALKSINTKLPTKVTIKKKDHPEG